MTNNSELLTDKEAAEFLRVSHQTMWRLRKCGKLPHVRLATKLLYRKSDLEAFIEQNTKNKQAEK